MLNCQEYSLNSLSFMNIISVTSMEVLAKNFEDLCFYFRLGKFIANGINYINEML